MIANLPLLFANGNPTALTKITASELEKFITFMVTCSWGHDTAKDIRQPPWWPNDVRFSHPFVRPDTVPKDWEARLKNLVRKCYDFHKSAFLLVFSAQLARYPRNRLAYVDNHDHTTSLYYRPSNRLLVTFRNENLFYDRGTSPSPSVIFVEEPRLKPTDIYLCDSCDSHFDNFQTLKAHERLCNNENLPSSTCNGGLSEFLSALKLLPVGESTNPNANQGDSENSKPRNSRTAASIDRGPPYPFSSLAYIRNAKTNIQRDTTYSRERVERYCCTSTPFSKYLVSKVKNQPFPVRYRRPIDHWNRKYTFPQQRKKKVLDLKGQLYMLKCRPVKVNVERMSMAKIQEYLDKLKAEAESRVVCLDDKDVVYVDGLDCDQSEENEARDPLKRQEECEVIDLCSDDEDGSGLENVDPRAGVTCVMRGGAVLRRTATAPAPQLPAPPCGALLHPHPVILIATTLNNLQTISLD